MAPRVVLSSLIFVCVAFLTTNRCVARVAVLPTDILPPQSEINDIFTVKEPKMDTLAQRSNLSAFMHERDEFIEEEQLLLSGGHLKLNERELEVHKIFMRYKLMELTHGMDHDEEHAPGMHFFKAKPYIERSKVFEFLRAMPKGAILHVHNTAAVSSEWVVSNLTYLPGLVSCISENGNVILSFRHAVDHNCRSEYHVVGDQRSRTRTPHQYDKFLEQKINLHTSWPEVEYNTIDKVWDRFENMFETMGDMLSYMPAFKLFHWRLMEEMYEDKVMYAEVRMRFRQLYGDNDVMITANEAADILFNLVNEFKASHPGFLGIKVIYATNRRANLKKVEKIFNTFKEFHARYPDFVIGFDLVGQEDKGQDLIMFVNMLQQLPKTAKYFFHAGETKWYGSTIDLNLIDAILMNTTRIGHGYALMKHPILSKAVKEREIGIEVSPISNQVLNLVWDLRNHPGGYFMSDNIPMVISNDDPGFWNAKGLSYDYYYAIMSFAPNNAGLKTLKNLAWSSIKYSAMREMEKTAAYAQLQTAWDEFLERVLSGDVI